MPWVFVGRGQERRIMAGMKKRLGDYEKEEMLSRRVFIVLFAHQGEIESFEMPCWLVMQNSSLTETGWISFCKN